jgi:menaquinone-dependent protoporphyrinogen oxidase
MTVLVAYATKNGSTAEIARWIAEELSAAGLAVEVRPAAQVRDVSGYHAVVLGAAVYLGGWHTDARSFAHRFAGDLADRPVWLFSSGPLDTSADDADLPPIPQVAAAMRDLHARGQVTFGGRLSEDGHGWLGFLARRMVREGHGGDFRNPARVRAWARGIAAALTSAGTAAAGSP